MHFDPVPTPQNQEKKPLQKKSFYPKGWSIFSPNKENPTAMEVLKELRGINEYKGPARLLMILPIAIEGITGALGIKEGFQKLKKLNKLPMSNKQKKGESSNDFNRELHRILGEGNIFSLSKVLHSRRKKLRFSSVKVITHQHHP